MLRFKFIYQCVPPDRKTGKKDMIHSRVCIAMIGNASGFQKNASVENNARRIISARNVKLTSDP